MIARHNLTEKIMRTLGFLLLATFLMGCSPSPPELQNLSSVEVQVVRDGTPVEGVLVALYSEEPQGVVGCNALTDWQGVAVLRTSVQTTAAKGVKPGNYKVVFTKNVVWPSDLADFEADQLLPESERAICQQRREDFLNENRIVPKEWESSETTPIRMEVKAKEKNSLTVDLAKQ